MQILCYCLARCMLVCNNFTCAPRALVRHLIQLFPFPAFHNPPPKAQQSPVDQDAAIIDASRSHSNTPNSVGSSGQVIGPTWRLPDNTQTSIHAPGGVRNHNPSMRAAADPRLRLQLHWGQKRHNTAVRTDYR